MTLAHVVISGNVTKAPEKRFSQNNLAVTSFVIDANPQDETLVRVVAIGSLAEKAADILKPGDTALVDGRLQTQSVKSENGRDRKYFEINASSIEKISIESSGSSYSAGGISGGHQKQQAPSSNFKNQNAKSPQSEQIVQFGTEDISEDLIDEDEIPF